MMLSESLPVPADLDLVPGKATIVSVLKKRVLSDSGRTAYTYVSDGNEEEITITYGKLASEATKVASILQKKGYQGKRVLMFYPSGIDFIVAFFGCLMAGVIPVPAFPPRKNRSLLRIQAIVGNSGAAGILTTESISKQLKRNFSEDALLKDLEWIITENLPEVSVVPDIPEPAFDDIAFLQYTSGSTGTPKGVMVTHGNIMYNLRSLQLFFKITKDDIIVNWVPQFHDLGLIFGILGTVFSGITAVLLSPVSFISNPLFLLKTISRYKATIAGQPDFAFNLLVDKTTPEDRAALDLSSLKGFYSAAEPVRKSTFDRFLEAFAQCGVRPEILFPGYGLAESTLVITASELGTPPFYLPVKASLLENNIVEIADENSDDMRWITGNGTPRMDTQVIIADPDTLQECEPGKVGEIWAKGSIITKGYYGKPELTNEVYNISLAGKIEPVWFRTGDLGFIYNDQLFITGRLKDLIIINGRNYYPQDIELTVEESHTAVRKNCVAAYSFDQKGKERLGVVAELHRTIIPHDTEKIIGAVISGISREFEITPSRITLVRTGSVPKTSSGKIMRNAAGEMVISGKMNVIDDKITGSEDEVKYDPENVDKPDLEQFLVSWISFNLNEGNAVDTQNSLAAYGIDSIRAVLLTDDTKNMFGFEWPPYLFFEEISIRQLAQEGMKLMNEE